MDIVERFKQNAIFEEETGKWTIPGSFAFPSTTSKEFIEAIPKNNPSIAVTLSPNLHPMFDSGLGAHSDVSSSQESHASAGKDLVEKRKLVDEADEERRPPNWTKRPVSMVGLRRPMCDMERVALTQFRQRMKRNAQTPTGMFASTSDACAPSFVISDEAVRFCCENLISFTSLKHYPSRVRHREAIEERNNRHSVSSCSSSSAFSRPKSTEMARLSMSSSVIN